MIMFLAAIGGLTLICFTLLGTALGLIWLFRVDTTNWEALEEEFRKQRGDELHEKLQ
jgi:hypothetical protein